MMPHMPIPRDCPAHICSLVVHIRPKHLQPSCAQLALLPGVELHGQTPAGKAVITLESRSESEVLDTITQINNLPGVLNTNLIFHQYDGAESAQELP